MPKMLYHIMRLLPVVATLGALSLCPAVIPHEESEADYWTMEQFYQDSVYRFPHKLPDQLPYMREPGAKCDPKKHFDSIIYHHSIRHGLAKVSHRQFIRILNQMCTVIPNFGVIDFYQTFRCYMRRCDCPFDFLTWSHSERKCKIRVNFPCGDVQVLNETVRLDDVFGCEDGSVCVMKEGSKDGEEGGDADNSDVEDVIGRKTDEDSINESGGDNPGGSDSDDGETTDSDATGTSDYDTSSSSGDHAGVGESEDTGSSDDDDTSSSTSDTAEDEDSETTTASDDEETTSETEQTVRRKRQDPHEEPEEPSEPENGEKEEEEDSTSEIDDSSTTTLDDSTSEPSENSTDNISTTDLSNSSTTDQPTFSTTKDTLEMKLLSAVCTCIQGRVCGKMRRRPAKHNRIPPDYPLSSAPDFHASSFVIIFLPLLDFLT